MSLDAQTFMKIENNVSVFCLLQLQTFKNLRHFLSSQCFCDPFPLISSLLPLPTRKHQQKRNRKALCQTEINIYPEYAFQCDIDSAQGHLDEADHH